MAICFLVIFVLGRGYLQLLFASKRSSHVLLSGSSLRLTSCKCQNNGQHLQKRSHSCQESSFVTNHGSRIWPLIHLPAPGMKHLSIVCREGKANGVKGSSLPLRFNVRDYCDPNLAVSSVLVSSEALVLNRPQKSRRRSFVYVRSPSSRFATCVRE